MNELQQLRSAIDLLSHFEMALILSKYENLEQKYKECPKHWTVFLYENNQDIAKLVDETTVGQDRLENPHIVGSQVEFIDYFIRKRIVKEFLDNNISKES